MSDTTPPLFRRYQLAELAAPGADTFVDGPFGSSLKSHEYVDAGVRLIQLQNIGEGEWRDDNKKFITPQKFKTLARHGAIPGDIAIAKMADPVARACLVPPVSEDFVVVADCIRLRLDEARFDPGFVVRSINSPSTRREAEQKAIGSTRVRINLSELKTVGCLAPALQEQRAITRVLDTLDTAIQETEAIIAKLKAVKQGLLHGLLTRGIDANGELRPPQAEAPHLYKESPLGWIPKVWGCVRLVEKLGVFGGKQLPAGHSYANHPTTFKYLRVTDFFDREYSLAELENLHERTFKALERYEIRSGQLYISIAGSLGWVGVHRADGHEGVRTILTENAARLVPLCKLVPEFVAAYMNSNMVQTQVTSEKGTGGGVPKLALFRIEQFRLAWPEEDEQNLIAERLQKIDERISYETQLSRKLILEKSGLMDDLLTGRVRVTPLLEGVAP